MKIENINIYQKANNIVKQLYGENANFREGQYEAIESVFTHKRTLVVQRTGWGKSLIYFISTKLMKETTNSPTIVISPLLILMKNQIEMANKLGLTAVALNSKSNKKEIIELWKNNKLDIIFITPETLFNELIQKELPNLSIGLFVIDEAHCISDWGHDFRLEYFKLSEIIKILPQNVPLLATTATATNRVINDLKNQLGENLYISRGPLTRKSLNIQVLNLDTKVEKYAFILENINKLPGSGIIYCLTKWDCEKLAKFLQKNGIKALPYHSKLDETETIITENYFKENKIKVIVATTKLGMGYDKSDINFVIHLHMPQNIVSYYQQIGRAGRSLNKAYIFLLKGTEDEKIIDHFIDSAFPTEKEETTIYQVIENADDGLRKNEIFSQVNLKRGRIEKTLTFLENDKYIFKSESKYYTTPKVFNYNQYHYQQITEIRLKEKQKMIDLTKTTYCYSKYIVNALDDYSGNNCGKCSNCLQKNIIDFTISKETIDISKKYLLKELYEITPRKKDEYSKNLLYINEIGICLSKYGDYGYGQMVEEDKYNSTKYREELINRSAEVLKEKLIDKHNIKYITYIPSTRNNKVELLANEIATKLNIICLDIFEKNNCDSQKNMENSFFQSSNAKENYKIKANFKPVDKIIIIDDIVDSKWTLTWCGYYLKEQGVKEVYPFTLSDSSDRKE